MKTTIKNLLLQALAGLVLILALACGLPSSSIAPTTSHTYPVTLNYVLATNILEVGEQRVAFLLSTPNGTLKTSSAMVTPVYLEGEGSTGSTIEAQFNLWPYGIRGAYTIYANFDQPGLWRLDVEVDNPDGENEVQIELKVLDNSPVPSVASKALLSETKTLARYEEIEQITTDYSPDPDLYQLSVHEAVQNGRPSVIVFASPAFCTSPTCGPQVDTLTNLKEKHPELADYIHIEIYDNPAEIQGDLDRAEIFSVVDDWGLTSIKDYLNESWTFVVDSNGDIRNRFEGFATIEELEIALMKSITDA